MAQHRQLAAILFTDIEGYSSLVQQQEQLAARLGERHREILRKEHQHHGGRLIQHYGEGTLSIFPSAVEAVRCALDMQQLFVLEPPVPVRMGLHIGDIIMGEEQVIGDGVNLASRIQSLGVAGSVLLSDKVNDEILNHPDLHTVSVGTYQFKNILRPVEVFALNHEGLVVPPPNSLHGKIAARPQPPPKTRKAPDKSIAVLPLVNLSDDPEQKYFSDGVAEEILSALSNLPDLKVAGRTSSFQFNSKDKDLREVGEKLGVSTVLEGSVRKQGNRLRVTVQLVNVEDGFHLWSEKYDRTMDDIFAIQDEIASAVTEKMKVTFQEQGRGRTAKSYTQNPAAYELYLKGRFYINRRGPSILTGIRYCQQALELDPSFALAHAGYADGLLLTAFYGLLPPSQILGKAREAAETAIELDPALCEPYCSLGFYYVCCEWNWPDAKKNYLKSIDRNPQYAQAHAWYGITYLAWVEGNYELAEEQGRLAIKHDPLNPNSYAAYSVILHAAGKYQEALEASQSGLELDINHYLCHLYTANANVGLQRYAAALQAYDRALAVSNRHAFALNVKLITCCKMGDMDQARLLMQEVKERASREYVGSAFIGLSEAWLGDLEAAIRYLEKAYHDRESVLLTFRTELWVPGFLRADARFQRIMDKMAFPLKWQE
jgi:TolB-like protein/class 3 adenylate cyclase/tetratricopeptide (TPR) repeat protein